MSFLQFILVFPYPTQSKVMVLMHQFSDLFAQSSKLVL